MSVELPAEIVGIIAQYCVSAQSPCLMQDIETFALYPKLVDLFEQHFGSFKQKSEFFFINHLLTYVERRIRGDTTKKIFLKMTPQQRVEFHDYWIIIFDRCRSRKR